MPRRRPIQSTSASESSVPPTSQLADAAPSGWRRRDFLGAGIAGWAGAASGISGQAQPAPAPPDPDLPPVPAPETSYRDRTDSFEEKMKLLEAAWRRRDFRTARALTHSLRHTLLQAQAEQTPLEAPVVPLDRAQSTTALPEAWRDWAQGWTHFQVIALENPGGHERPSEPVEFPFAVAADAVTSLAREVRVARVVNGTLREVPSQVFHEVRRGSVRQARVMLLAETQRGEQPVFLVFYGNPDAELPGYISDLSTTGEGWGLDIENAHFRAALSRQTGQLERLTLKREHGLELFSGGEGHGEPPGIDWAHDYVASGSFQKLRISLWEACPDYEVVRGPLCTRVRRWGFPLSPVHPLFSPSRLHIDIEYRFYSGLPWFQKLGSLEATRSFEVETLRDDEWVFSGQSFTDTLWMGRDGHLRTGAVEPSQAEDLWGVGFFNSRSHDAFVALFLEHTVEGVPKIRHAGAPTLDYRWHGQLWSRAPLGHQRLPAGAVIRERNAYLAAPFFPDQSPAQIEALRRQLTEPLRPMTAAALPNLNASRPAATRLARPGELGDAAISKRAIWAALRDCKDAQLYTADIDVVDLGLIRDVRVRGDVVHLTMTMPHRGRPRTGYFGHGSISVHPTLSKPIRERLLQLAGVREVVIEPSWDPPWSSNDLTEAGRRKLGV